MASSALILMLFIFVPVALGVFLIVSSRARGDSSPRCGHCQYDLTGSESNRCPECGRLFIEAGVVKQRRAASRPRFWLGVAALLIAVFFGVGGLLSVMMAERARAAQARAMAARNQALVQQAIALRAAAATRPSLVDADDDALGVSTPMD